MLSKEEIEESKECLKEIIQNTYAEGKAKKLDNLMKYIEQLEKDKQKLIEKLKERIKSVEKCYEDLIKPYYDEKLNVINTSLMTKKEKEEFINKRNCLLVQKHCYEEILSILKGENK